MACKQATAQDPENRSPSKKESKSTKAEQMRKIHSHFLSFPLRLSHNFCRSTPNTPQPPKTLKEEHSKEEREKHPKKPKGPRECVFAEDPRAPNASQNTFRSIPERAVKATVNTFSFSSWVRSVYRPAVYSRPWRSFKIWVQREKGKEGKKAKRYGDPSKEREKETPLLLGCAENSSCREDNDEEGFIAGGGGGRKDHVELHSQVTRITRREKELERESMCILFLGIDRDGHVVDRARRRKLRPNNRNGKFDFFSFCHFWGFCLAGRVGKSLNPTYCC